MRMQSMAVCFAVLASSGCADTCESVEDEIQQIGREIRKDPESAFDRAKEL